MPNIAEHVPRVSPAKVTLRTDLFKTRLRDQTLGIRFVYTYSVPDPRIDAAYLDYREACRKNLGISYHYVICTNGDIEVSRDPMTISAAGPRYQRSTHIAVGVVGGLSETTGKSCKTLTAAQADSMSYLEQALSDALNVPLEIEDEAIHRTADVELNQFDAATDTLLDHVHRQMTPEELAQKA